MGHQLCPASNQATHLSKSFRVVVHDILVLCHCISIMSVLTSRVDYDQRVRNKEPEVGYKPLINAAKQSGASQWLPTAQSSTSVAPMQTQAHHPLANQAARSHGNSVTVIMDVRGEGGAELAPSLSLLMQCKWVDVKSSCDVHLVLTLSTQTI